MRKIIYTRPDGGLSVVHPAQGIPEAQVWDRLPPDAINPQWVDESVIPADRTFREAWTHGGTTVTVDMGKAKEIQAKRAADAALSASVEAQKQAALASLDMSAINAATTPEELMGKA